MEKRKKEQRAVAENVDDLYGALNSVVSTTESTGLMPSRPATADAANAYSEIYEIPVPEEYKDFKFRRRST